MRILLAEDNFVTRKLMVAILSQYGECDVAVDGMEAVDAFLMALEDGKPYDLICLDIMMPVMDGFQALVGIRNLEKERNIAEKQAVKVIVTTALRDEKHAKMEEMEISYENWYFYYGSDNGRDVSAVGYDVAQCHIAGREKYYEPDDRFR